MPQHVFTSSVHDVFRIIANLALVDPLNVVTISAMSETLISKAALHREMDQGSIGYDERSNQVSKNIYNPIDFNEKACTFADLHIFRV